MTINFCGVGIHFLFSGNVQNVGKEQSGGTKGKAESPGIHRTANILALLGCPGKGKTRDGFPIF